MSALPPVLSPKERLAALKATERYYIAAWEAARAAGNHPVAMHYSDMMDGIEDRIATLEDEISRSRWSFSSREYGKPIANLDRDLAALAADLQRDDPAVREMTVRSLGKRVALFDEPE